MMFESLWMLLPPWSGHKILSLKWWPGTNTIVLKLNTNGDQHYIMCRSNFLSVFHKMSCNRIIYFSLANHSECINFTIYNREKIRRLFLSEKNSKTLNIDELPLYFNNAIQLCLTLNFLATLICTIPSKILIWWDHRSTFPNFFTIKWRTSTVNYK